MVWPRLSNCSMLTTGLEVQKLLGKDKVLFHFPRHINGHFPKNGPNLSNWFCLSLKKGAFSDLWVRRLLRLWSMPIPCVNTSPWSVKSIQKCLRAQVRWIWEQTWKEKSKEGTWSPKKQRLEESSSLCADPSSTTVIIDTWWLFRELHSAPPAVEV